MVATFEIPGLRHVRIGICALLVALCGTPAIAAPNYDFAYRVTGDRRVAPQQVFDDGVSTYLQFYPGQVLPALIAVSNDGSQRLLTHAQLGPYVTVPGTHAALVAQLGNVRAVIDYGGKGARVVGEDAMGLAAPAQSVAQPVVPPAAQGVPFTPPWVGAGNSAPTVSSQAAPTRTSSTSQHVASMASGANSPAYSGPTAFNTAPSTLAAPAGATALNVSYPSNAPASGLQANAALPSRDIAPVVAAPDTSTVSEAWPTTAAPPAKPFEATLADQNLRRALAKWATQAGWTFRPEHWTPDIDIAVSAPAVFGPDFKTAVRGLLAGTELSAKPLQPCFYSNLVLRVVPQTERCDRRVAQ